MKRIFLCLRAPLLVFSTVFAASAQSTNATISGLIRDPSGRAVPEATIEMADAATGHRYTTKTNGDGIYSLSILPPAQYIVQVSKGGFKTLIKPGIILNVQSALF